MANKKISALDPLATPADGDILPITDISDTITSGSADGTTKGVTVANLMAVAPVQTSDISGLASAVQPTDSINVLADVDTSTAAPTTNPPRL